MTLQAGEKANQVLNDQLKKNKQWRKKREYKGYMIHDCSMNSSGMKYFAFGNNGVLKAQTKLGIKALITLDIIKGA